MQRHYGMDWLRIGAFGLLIFYHIGMFFVPWGWHVKTAVPRDWVAVPMLATNAWRLPLLFVVSGFATAAVLAKSKGLGSFLGNRSARLMVPTLFAMIVIIPPQPWIELVTQHGYAASFAHFWARDYFRFGALEGIVLPTWQHLWFVVYLWVYTLALAAILTMTPASARATLTRVLDRVLGGPGLLLVPLGWLAVQLAIAGPGANPTHALVDDGVGHRMFLPAFLFGVLLADAPQTWAAIRRWWKAAAGLAILAYAIVAAIEIAWPGDARAPLGVSILFGAARLAQGWFAIVALIGLADRHWNCDHAWRKTLTEAVFPFYIIHQTIIVVLGWYLLRLALPPSAEFALLLAATAGGCWLFYALGREIGWLRPLIGLRRVARPQRSAREGAPANGVP